MAKKKTTETNGDNENLSSLIDDLFKEDENYVKFSEVDTAVKNWTDSGCYALNFIMSNSFFKGYPNGRTTILEGLPSAGKSLFLSTSLRDQTVDLGIVIETEGDGLSKDLLDFAGVDSSKVRQMKIRSYDCFRVLENGNIEEVRDSDYSPTNKSHEAGLIYKVQRIIDVIKNSKTNKKVILGIDSMANISSAKEIGGGGSDMGKKNQLINRFFRVFDNVFNKLNVACLITNKLYTNVGAGQYEEKYVSAGGVAPEYNASLILRLEKVSNSNTLNDAELKEEKENMKTARGASIVSTKVKVSKSRFGTFGRQIILQIDMNKGLLKYSGMFDLCNDYELLEKVGARYAFVNKDIYPESFYRKDFTEVICTGGEEILRKIESAIYEVQKDDNKESAELTEEQIQEDEAINEMTKAME